MNPVPRAVKPARLVRRNAVPKSPSPPITTLAHSLSVVTPPPVAAAHLHDPTTPPPPIPRPQVRRGNRCSIDRQVRPVRHPFLHSSHVKMAQQKQAGFGDLVMGLGDDGSTRHPIRPANAMSLAPMCRDAVFRSSHGMKTWHAASIRLLFRHHQILIGF